jgi:hypothetical protein
VATTARRSKNGVTRREFSELVRQVEDCTRNVALQFIRIAQIQAELDHLRLAGARWKTGKHRRR